MVAIVEKEEVSKIHFDIWIENFDDYKESPEELERDWKLIQEAEKAYDPKKCMTAEEAYIKIKKYISNLK